MYIMLLLGIVVSAFIYGALLGNYSPLRLIQVVQGPVVVTVLLNGITMWKKEARNCARARNPQPRVAFGEAWARLTARSGMVQLLCGIALGPAGFGMAGFGMADVLFEPFGGQVLWMTVAQTTRLTILLATGTLIGLVLASRVVLRGGHPMALAWVGAMVGVPAFAAVIVSGLSGTVPLLPIGTLEAGFGADLFGYGTLTATMRAAPRDQIGPALGAWGAVQTTAAGVGVAFAGVLRDHISAGSTDSASPCLPRFAIEIGLLLLASIAALRFPRTGLGAGTLMATTDDEPQRAAAPLLAGPPT